MHVFKNLLKPGFSFFTVVYLLTAATAQAHISLPYVQNYNKAADQSVWNGSHQGEVPSTLTSWGYFDGPSEAYQAPYPNILLQTKKYVVCWMDCSKPQPFSFSKIAGDYKPVSDGKELLAVGTVYYWLGQLFSRMSQLGFEPTKQLEVIVNRHIPDPTSGIDSTNNAFFYDKNWSLNFLDSQNTWFLTQIGQDMLPSFFDPSVAMHEATHSIFQALIGDVINSEIFGLHEAFADYFSLSILDTSQLGLIMMRGKTVRTADHIGQYKPGMEAHNLGNIVLSALWKIRSNAQDKILADRVALETIRQVSYNPYAVAGDVVTAYSEALQKFPSAGMPSATFIKGVWDSTGLKPEALKPNMDALNAPLKSGVVRAAKVVEDVPQDIASQWAVPAHDESTIAVFDVRNGPNDKAIWFCIGTSKGDNSPVWILMDGSVNGIAAAYIVSHGQLSLIQRAGSSFEKLKDISDKFSSAIEIATPFPNRVAPLFDIKNSNTPVIKHLFKNGAIQKDAGPQVQFNGDSLNTVAYSREVKPAFLGKVLEDLSSVTDPSLQELFKTVVGVTLYSVPQSSFKDDKVLKLGSMDTVIGYSLHMNSGTRESTILTDYAGAFSYKPPASAQQGRSAMPNQAHFRRTRR